MNRVSRRCTYGRSIERWVCGAPKAIKYILGRGPGLELELPFALFNFLFPIYYPVFLERFS